LPLKLNLLLFLAIIRAILSRGNKMGRAFEYRKASKLKRWGKMSVIFPKLGKAITVAAKNGVPDPEMNAPLRTAILNAKAENMPKTNIEAAIKRAMSKDLKDMLEVTFEGKGPHGVQIFVECLTDNNTRSVANIKNYFSKLKGQMLNNGALDYMFDRKAIFEFDKTENIDIEELELELIDSGLEEIEAEDGLVIITTQVSDFGIMNEVLEKMNIKLNKATLERIPTNQTSFNEEEMQDISKLLEKLEDDEDVQKVFTNIK
jgi:YebC/PmpR family DNA-binding regulatory protein